MSIDTRKMMVFIDGENITLRYKAMLDSGRIPKASVVYKEDAYIWDRSIIYFPTHDIIRATYYTYIVGDDNKINELENEIKQLDYNAESSSLPNKLYPCVFKKSNREKSGKGVDIQMTVDILNHVNKNNLDTVYLISGDGDYFPVINEIIRGGKHIYLAAFSNGLSPKLKNIVDDFIDLDKIVFSE